MAGREEHSQDTNSRNSRYASGSDSGTQTTVFSAQQSEMQNSGSPRLTPTSTLASEGEEIATVSIDGPPFLGRAELDAGPSNSRKRRLSNDDSAGLEDGEKSVGGSELLNTGVFATDTESAPQDKASEESIQPTKKRRVEGTGSQSLSPLEQHTEALSIVHTDTPPDSANDNDDGHRPNKKARLNSDIASAAGGSSVSVVNVHSSTVAPGNSQPSVALSGYFEAKKPSPFLTLPLELLSEVLILSGSPQHVLAIARTCKALCHTLLNADAEFIWREARKGCSFVVPEIGNNPTFDAQTLQSWFPPPPAPAGPNVAGDAPVNRRVVVSLPDLPRQFFTESSYAAFLFDSGKCECCGNETGLLYESFALRIRKCRNSSCKSPPGIVRYQHNGSQGLGVLSILPTIESNTCMNNFSPPTFWPQTEQNMHIHYRSEAVEAAKREHREKVNDEDYKKKFALLQVRKREWMEAFDLQFCVKLSKWRKLRQFSYHRNKDANEKKAKTIANKYGWDYSDLTNCTVFGAYHKHKSRLCETINETDVKVMQEEIESQLIAVGDKRDRRNAEISLMENRKDVEGVYNRLRSAKTYQYLPSLVTFRTLPVISLLQTAEKLPGAPSHATGPKVAETLQNNPVMKEMLASQLRKWADNAKQDISQTLGFPRNWKSASKNVVHPAERVTARLLCTRCNRVDSKYSQDGCLDFAGACRHECFVGSEKKAINVLSKTLQALGYPEDRDAGHYILTIGIAALCTSCDPPMVVDTRNIIGHSHRHEEMQVDFTSDVEKISSLLGGYPYTFGLAKKLLGSDAVHASAIKKEIDAKNFGCRHCLRTKQVTDAVATNPTTDAQANVASQVLTTTGAPGGIELSTVAHYSHDLGIEGPKERPPPLFNLNGLRSHLKAKHGLEGIRDEDILCYNAVAI
ncbi:unnamed protein product [Cyclocybe aegerita]|uniref:F-box domain-containing protein n=1 Tax=Cyclocybe aegerita TaxID=1973307 RepID=A0A8S0WRZ3_CYCAE|nr:unnamed protein product [Cyclocybe aegerita]